MHILIPYVHLADEISDQKPHTACARKPEVYDNPTVGAWPLLDHHSSKLLNEVLKIINFSQSTTSLLREGLVLLKYHHLPGDPYLGKFFIGMLGRTFCCYFYFILLLRGAVFFNVVFFLWRCSSWFCWWDPVELLCFAYWVSVIWAVPLCWWLCSVGCDLGYSFGRILISASSVLQSWLHSGSIKVAVEKVFCMASSCYRIRPRRKSIWTYSITVTVWPFLLIFHSNHQCTAPSQKPVSVNLVIISLSGKCWEGILVGSFYQQDQRARRGGRILLVPERWSHSPYFCWLYQLSISFEITAKFPKLSCCHGNFCCFALNGLEADEAVVLS